MVANYGVKCLYIFSNILAMSILHQLMNEHFYSYGIEWLAWSRGTSAERLYFEARNEPTPGNRILPIFGMCDLYDVRHDATTDYGNKVTVVCEMSSYAVYQHTLVVIWCLLVFSNASAIIGLFYYLGHHLYMVHKAKSTANAGLLFKQYMTLREMEYLECLKDLDLSMYKKVEKILDDNLMNTDERSKIPFTPIQVLAM